MARITKFTELETSTRDRSHSEVECGYRFVELDGTRMLQLDTYGSNDRQIPGKVSQSIQIDEAAAATLLNLLRKAFPSLS